MITIWSNNIHVDLRVRSSINGRLGTIVEYDKTYVEPNMRDDLARKGLMAIEWDNGSVTKNYLHDPTIGTGLHGAPFSTVSPLA